MKKPTLLLPLITCLFLDCSSAQKPGAYTSNKTSEETAPPPAISNRKNVSNSRLRATADSILDALKNQNTTQLSKWIHPQWKLHFSPYGYINKQEGHTLNGAEIQAAFQKGNQFYWGLYDGSGDSIVLDLQDYLRKFVLDRDFRNAPAVAVDSIIGRGNTFVNTQEVYPEARVVEYHFPGQEAQGFMDWKSLRLVFQKAAGRIWLVCIAHDQWTT